MDTSLKLGDIVEAEVTKITDFGAFAKINNGSNFGLIHISQISDDFVKNINQHLKIGDKIKAKVIKLGPGNKIDLSLKKAEFSSTKNKSGLAARQAGFKSSDFEEKLKRFLQQSQRSLADLKKRTEEKVR